MIIQSHLKEIMVKQGFSRMDVVYGTKLSIPAVTRWEQPTLSRLDPRTLGALCAFLKVSVNELITFIPEGDEIIP